MGFKLNKPFLRASMELDCQRIARGDITKEEVIFNCIENMRECFIQCKREGNMLDDAMNKHFPNNRDLELNFNIINRNISSCGTCNRGMSLRQTLLPDNSIGNTYLYCNTCRINHNLPNKSSFKASEHKCQICQFQALIVSYPDKRDYNICPNCYKNPPSTPIAIEDNMIDFRCYQCTHNNCLLATGFIYLY
jgi:DNA topoisomerase-3